MITEDCDLVTHVLSNCTVFQLMAKDTIRSVHLSPYTSLKYPLITYFRSHVTEHLAVIGAHSGLRVTKCSMAVSQTLISLAMEGDGSDHVHM